MIRFEVVHEFDAPLEVVERLITSPTLIDVLGPRMPHVEKVTQLEHRDDAAGVRRVWRYEPSVATFAVVRAWVKPEMCSWEERSTYSRQARASEWVIVPAGKPEWSKYFRAHGTYALVAAEGGTTKRVASGEIVLRAPAVVRQLAERMIVSGVKGSFDTEAKVLRDATRAATQ